MKLLLVNPYFEVGHTRETLVTVDAPPLGLGFLATYIRSKLRWEVEVLDPVVAGVAYDEVLFRAGQSDVVGASCYADIRFNSFDFLKDVKTRFPGVMTVIGGPHATSLPEAIMKAVPQIDYLVRGEGELTLFELLSGRSASTILGLTYREDGAIVSNPDRPFIQDIDELKVDYSLFGPLERYPTDIEASRGMRALRTGYLIGSRGCPFLCGFCSNAQWKRRWRAVSPEALIDTMRELHAGYGVEYFRFFDDLFTADQVRVRRFCQLLRESGLKVKMRVLCRAGTPPELLELLRDVGCVSVGFGIESGSDRVLALMNKGTTMETIQKTVEDCQRLGLWVVGSFVLSIPGETLEDVKRTFEATRLPDSMMVNIHKLYPNTPFYESLKDHGEVSDEIWFDRSLEGPIIYCRENIPSAAFSLKELKWFYLYAQYRHALYHPRQVLKEFGGLRGTYKLSKAALDIPLQGRLNRIACALTGTPPL